MDTCKSEFWSAFPTGAVITMVPPVGGLSTASASTTAAGRLVLVVDPCVVGDGRVVQVAAWVKKGDRGTRPGPVCLSAQEVVDRGGSGDLGSAVG